MKHQQPRCQRPVEPFEHKAMNQRRPPSLAHPSPDETVTMSIDRTLPDPTLVWTRQLDARPHTVRQQRFAAKWRGQVFHASYFVCTPARSLFALTKNLQRVPGKTSHRRTRGVFGRAPDPPASSFTLVSRARGGVRRTGWRRSQRSWRARGLRVSATMGDVAASSGLARRRGGAVEIGGPSRIVRQVASRSWDLRSPSPLLPVANPGACLLLVRSLTAG